jgi:hypothetical protein
MQSPCIILAFLLNQCCAKRQHFLTGAGAALLYFAIYGPKDRIRNRSQSRSRIKIKKTPQQC